MKQSKKQAKKSKPKNAVYAVIGIAAVLVIAAIILFTGQKGYDTTQAVINSPAASIQASDMVIQKSGITETATFIPYKAGNTAMEVLAVKAPDGTIRTAFNTCQVCYDSGRGYYVQKGDELVCQNCGNRFKISQVEKEKNGCNPVPIMSSDKKEDDNTITISGSFLTDKRRCLQTGNDKKKEAEYMFAKIKKKINNYLNKLAKANEESFGNKQLDCCKVGKGERKK